MPKTEVTVVGPADAVAEMGEQALANERARQQAFVKAFLQGLSGSGFRILVETDAGAAAMPAGTPLLRLDVTDLPTVTDGRTGVVVGCIFFGSITVGLGYLACINARDRITQTAHFDVRLYDVSGAAAQRITRNGELVRVFDTSGIQPEFHQSYEVKVESGHHVMSSPQGQQALDFAVQQGARLGQVAYEAVASRMSTALQRMAQRSEVPPPGLVVARPPPSGGTNPVTTPPPPVPQAAAQPAPGAAAAQ